MCREHRRYWRSSREKRATVKNEENMVKHSRGPDLVETDVGHTKVTRPSPTDSTSIKRRPNKQTNARVGRPQASYVHIYLPHGCDGLRKTSIERKIKHMYTY